METSVVPARVFMGNRLREMKRVEGEDGTEDAAGWPELPVWTRADSDSRLADRPSHGEDFLCENVLGARDRSGCLTISQRGVAGTPTSATDPIGDRCKLGHLEAEAVAC